MSLALARRHSVLGGALRRRLIGIWPNTKNRPSIDASANFVVTSTKSMGAESYDRSRMFLRVASTCALAAACATFAASPAQARITKIQITAKESPTLAAIPGPASGSTKKSSGRRLARLDPNDPKNAVIVDLQLAPRNAAGKVEYSFDFYILKPMDLAKGNHKMLYEPPNRGRKTIARAQSRSRRRRSGFGERSSAAREFIPDAAGLFDVVQRLGLFGGNEFSRFQYDHHAADREKSRRLVDHRSVV